MNHRKTCSTPIGNHDVSTSDGGRGYVAEYFDKRLGRRDFTKYIGERLAADFACALAKHLQGSPEGRVPLELLKTIEMTWRQASGFSNKANDAIAKGLGELRAILDDDGICPTCDSRGLGCPVCQPEPEPVAAHQGMRAAFEATYPLQGEDAEMVTWCEKTGCYVSSPSRTPGFANLAEYRTDLYQAWFNGARSGQPVSETQPVPAAGPWIDGSPPSPWGSEAFLAYTVHGHKVVLSPLPEEYSYDFKTADDTYMMRASIKKWAQLSTSQFIDFDGKPEADQPAPVANEPVMLTAAAVVIDSDDGLRLDWLLEGGIAELVPGQVLIVADQDVTDDCGDGELYRLPPGGSA